MKYKASYDRIEVRTDYTRCEWILGDEILKKVDKASVILDIGCGTARKLVDLAPHVMEIIGVEPNPEMRDAALKRLASAGLTNVKILAGEAASLPVADESCHVVTAMLSWHNADEVHRVLRPGGWAIIENVGDRDKENIRRAFGKDRKGWRGRHLKLSPGELRQQYAAGYIRLFGEVICKESCWESVIDVEGLQLVLEQTPMVRDFNRVKDQDVIKRIIMEYGSSDGIRVLEHRYLICAQKKDTNYCKPILAREADSKGPR